MTQKQDIDFSTLNWVKQELDETLKQARQALEAYVDQPADKSQMRFCANYLHQVQGTLRMVELYGAAMVAEEMERLAHGLLDGEVKQTEESYTVLLRGMVQLPDYLERLQGGYRDIPVVLLPLLNDLRACRNEKLLSESALFNPDLTQPLPSSARGPSQPLPDAIARATAQKLRMAYQFALLKWFKGDEVKPNLAKLQAVLDRLMQSTAQLDGRRLWFVGGSLLDGILRDGIDSSVAVKLLYGRVDREIKKLIDGGEGVFAQLPPIELTKNLLYYAAHSTVASARISELQGIYRLGKLLPTQDEIEHAQTAMSGHNRALLDTVGGQVKEDLLKVKEALEYYLRAPEANVAELAPQGELLHRIGDTLGMLGLGVPRRIVLEQKEVILAVAAGKREAKEQTLLDVAGSLLYVESTLDDYIEGLGRGKENAEVTVGALELPQSEVRRILEATMKEAHSNLNQAKQDVVAFIESPWDHSKIEQIPRLLDEIAGAMRMLNLPEPAGLMEGIIRFTEIELLKHRRVPTAEQLDLLADAIASIEYFLESVRDQRPNRERILDVTRRSLEALGYWPLPGATSEADGGHSELEQPNDMLNFRDDFTTARIEVTGDTAGPSAAELREMPSIDLADAPVVEHGISPSSYASGEAEARIAVPGQTEFEASGQPVELTLETFDWAGSDPGIAPVASVSEEAAVLDIDLSALEAREPVVDATPVAQELTGIDWLDSMPAAPQPALSVGSDSDLWADGSTAPSSDIEILSLESLEAHPATDWIAEEAARADTEARAAEEARFAAEARAAEEARLAAEARAAEARAAEEARLAAEARAAEEARLTAEARAAEEARLAAEARAAEEARLAAEARAAEEARLAAEARAAEEARLAAEARAAEEARLAAEARAAEEARRAAEARAAEEARRAAEARAAEEARRAAEARAAEEARRAAEARAAEEARLAAEAAAFEEDVIPTPAPAAESLSLAAAHSTVTDIGFQVVPMDDIDEEIREVFLEEVQEEVQNLESQYPLWKVDTGNFEKLKPVRRSFHTLKGSGRLVGAMAIGEFSWKIENMLNRILDKSIHVNPAVLAILDEAIAALPELLSALKGEGNPRANIAGIMVIAERVSAGEEVFLPKNEPAAIGTGNAVAGHPSTAGLAQVSANLASAAEAVVAELPSPIVDEAVSAVSAATTDVFQEPETSERQPSAEVLAELPEVLRSDPGLLEILRSEMVVHVATMRDFLTAVHTGAPASVSHDLMRAVHTLNGAVSMVGLDFLADVLAPLEGLLKRLTAHHQFLDPRGLDLVDATCELCDSALLALERGGLSKLGSSDLVAEAIALRDDLPEVKPGASPYSAFGIHLDHLDDEAEHADREPADADETVAVLDFGEIDEIQAANEAVDSVDALIDPVDPETAHILANVSIAAASDSGVEVTSDEAVTAAAVTDFIESGDFRSSAFNAAESESVEAILLADVDETPIDTLAMPVVDVASTESDSAGSGMQSAEVAIADLGEFLDEPIAETVTGAFVEPAPSDDIGVPEAAATDASVEVALADLGEFLDEPLAEPVSEDPAPTVDSDVAEVAITDLGDLLTDATSESAPVDSIEILEPAVDSVATEIALADFDGVLDAAPADVASDERREAVLTEDIESPAVDADVAEVALADLDELGAMLVAFDDTESADSEAMTPAAADVPDQPADATALADLDALRDLPVPADDAMLFEADTIELLGLEGDLAPAESELGELAETVAEVEILELPEIEATAHGDSIGQAELDGLFGDLPVETTDAPASAWPAVEVDVSGDADSSADHLVDDDGLAGAVEDLDAFLASIGVPGEAFEGAPIEDFDAIASVPETSLADAFAEFDLASSPMIPEEVELATVSADGVDAGAEPQVEVVASTADSGIADDALVAVLHDEPVSELADIEALDIPELEPQAAADDAAPAIEVAVDAPPATTAIAELADIEALDIPELAPQAAADDMAPAIEVAVDAPPATAAIAELADVEALDIPELAPQAAADMAPASEVAVDAPPATAAIAELADVEALDIPELAPQAAADMAPAIEVAVDAPPATAAIAEAVLAPGPMVTPVGSTAAADVDPAGELDLPDLDRDLLEIFVQEGSDIIDAADSLMVRLREQPEDRDTIVALQRELHTLKGSARMTGLTPIGDLTHAMESLFEAVADGRVTSPRGSLEYLERSFDRLNTLVQRVARNQQIASPATIIHQLEQLTQGIDPSPAAAMVAATEAVPAVPVPTAASEPAPAVAPVSAPTVTAPTPARAEAPRRIEDDDARPQQQEMIRVRADLIDNLVNFAGEVSIYRSRLEAQIGGFRFNLQEFDVTTLRLKDQLRKLEMETEAQILSRFQREAQEDRARTDFDPLELDRFSTLQQLSRALAESVSDLISLQNLMDDIARQSETLLLQQSRVSSELQEGLMRTRMVPFESVVPRLRRIVRQTAAELGKKAQLKVEGAQGEMDRTVLERMTAPLEHMLRNALAHGLERPDQRVARGKPEEGTISIAVVREGTEVVIRVSDDGAGMNRDAIRSRAIERGLLRPEVQLSDRDLFQFIMESGFSTAEEVSKVAGRGVGMDVVHNEVKMLGGNLQIDSTRGRGSLFTVRLPFTLAITQAVMIKLADHIYAVPMSSVSGVMRMQRREFDRRLEQNQLDVTYAGDSFQIYDLGDLLAAPIKHAPEETQVPLLMTKTGDLRAAIRVSHVIGGKEIVVKSVGPQLSAVPGFFGATIMGDGSVVVILDLAPLVRHGLAVRQAPELAAELDLLPKAPEPEVERNPLIMVVDDSITMRKVTTRVLERHNLDVITAKDGLDAVEQLQDRIPDVVLLDIEMPRMDGYELATYIRNDPRLKHLPLIMITSRTGDKHRQRALEIGVDRYLGKPYQEADLVKNVQESLAHGRSTIRQ